MQKILVIGANGLIGQQIVSMLAQKSIPVKAMIRKPEQGALFDAAKVETILADLEGDFSAAFEGCSKVVFTAGSGASTGPDKTLLIDLWGAIKSVDLAKKYGIEHFIMISSSNSHNPDTGPVSIKPYLVAKFAADEYLKNSGQPYTILGPARLTNDNATGKIRTYRPATAEERTIPRADVAAATLYCLGNDHTKGQTIDLYQGDKFIQEELAKFSR